MIQIESGLIWGSLPRIIMLLLSRQYVKFLIMIISMAHYLTVTIGQLSITLKDCQNYKYGHKDI